MLGISDDKGVLKMIGYGRALKKAIVITPTTGALELLDAIKSVKEQFLEVDHLVVVDGKEYSKRTDDLFIYNEKLPAGVKADTDRIIRIDLPFNTGGGGFYGHRIMAGIGHLINHDYVLFLDQQKDQ
jgi:glycosyltransferase involved in cell wall biosynthesis